MVWTSGYDRQLEHYVRVTVKQIAIEINISPERFMMNELIRHQNTTI